MKLWKSDHVFDHPWETVMQAGFRKYPNPYSKSVKALDILRQEVDGGIIRTERLLQSHFRIPYWVSKLTGFSGVQYSYECIEIDLVKRSMTLKTRNLSGTRFAQVDVRLTYIPDFVNPQKTLLKQEACVSATLPAFNDSCERSFMKVYKKNVAKGRSGVEWIIQNSSSQYVQ